MLSLKMTMNDRDRGAHREVDLARAGADFDMRWLYDTQSREFFSTYQD